MEPKISLHWTKWPSGAGQCKLQNKTKKTAKSLSIAAQAILCPPIDRIAPPPGNPETSLRLGQRHHGPRDARLGFPRRLTEPGKARQDPPPVLLELSEWRHAGQTFTRSHRIVVPFDMVPGSFPHIKGLSPNLGNPSITRGTPTGNRPWLCGSTAKQPEAADLCASLS